nr:MAG TPA: hypothetical protein [Caudoviricetes sp.]
MWTLLVILYSFISKVSITTRYNTINFYIK